MFGSPGVASAQQLLPPGTAKAYRARLAAMTAFWKPRADCRPDYRGPGESGRYHAARL